MNGCAAEHAVGNETVDAVRYSFGRAAAAALFGASGASTEITISRSMASAGANCSDIEQSIGAREQYMINKDMETQLNI
jgi:hypothetical protein